MALKLKFERDPCFPVGDDMMMTITPKGEKQEESALYTVVSREERDGDIWYEFKRKGTQ